MHVIVLMGHLKKEKQNSKNECHSLDEMIKVITNLQLV